jgi:RNA polymerase sigma-54 factor
VAANYILELSSLELQQAINRELTDNPALELLDMPTCHACGGELHGSICPRCIQRQKRDDYPPDPDGLASRDPAYRDTGPTRDDDFDPLTLVASEETLAEKLLRDLGVLLAPADLRIAEFLVGSLDERGYLTISLDDAAAELGVDRERVRAVLKAMHGLEPAGVGARNLRECLLIQLDQLEQLGVSRPHVRDLVSTYLPELAERKFARIAGELKLSLDEVADAYEFVKLKLNPHPAQGFGATNARDRDTRALYVIPDVVIARTAEGFEVDIVESRRHALRVNPMYMQLNSELGRGKRPTGPLSSQDKRHVHQHVNRAKLFIAAINQRRQTLLTITRCLVDKQREFLEQGIRHLRPLSRAAVAVELGVHESTVSRATAGKYAMLPSGEVIPFSHFFTPSLSIKDIIKEIVERERAPLTDAQIGERLRRDGIVIARRTVAKYRMQLDILPSSLR